MFKRASDACGEIAPPEANPDPVFGVYPRMLLKQKDVLLPAYPPIAHLYKLAEADPTLEGKKKATKERYAVLAAEVSGLCYKDWKIPVPEKEVLPVGSSSKRAGKDKGPKPNSILGQHIDKLATEGWYANMRCASLLSCAGMVTQYARRLSDTKGSDDHFKALGVAGIDSDDFADVVLSEAGMRYIEEMEQVTEVLAGLLFSMALEVGTNTATTTLCRRRVWLESMGCREDRLHVWMGNPTPSNSGLIGATAEQVAVFKAEQTNREVVQKELAASLKKPTPQTPVPTRRGEYHATASNNMRAAYAARGRGGRGKNKFRPQHKKPADKTTVVATSVADTSKPKPNAKDKG